MKHPVAFFITISTYGTWLPGDQRGWVEYSHGWQLPDAQRQLEASARMAENAKLLTPHQRLLVESQINETCLYRSWICHAVNCRTNHMHALVSAPEASPKKVRSDLKAWCTRRLTEDALPLKADRWWSDRGSIRWVCDEDSLQRVLYYVREQQDCGRD